jgi:hypothetical protein
MIGSPLGRRCSAPLVLELIGGGATTGLTSAVKASRSTTFP